MKKQKDGTGKREERIKSGNNEIVNPKEREMPRLGKKKKKKKIVSKTCSDVDVIWLT